MLKFERRLKMPRAGLPLVTLAILAFGGSAAAVAQQGAGRPVPAADAGEAKGERYWTVNWDFTDVDVAKLSERLKSLGLDIGVEASGRVTTHLTVGIPWTSLRNAQAYRIDGTLSSDQLVVDDLDLSGLQTTIRYRDGIAQLSNLEASVADERDGGSTPGRIKGKGAVELVPRGDVVADLQVDDFVLQPLLDIVAKFAPGRTDAIQRGGRATGKLTFRAPLERIDEVQTYQLAGELKWLDVQFTGFPPASVDLNGLVAQQGRLKIEAFDFESEATTQAEDIRLNGRADIPLTRQGDFTFTVNGDDVPLRSVVALAAAYSDSWSRPIVDGKVDLRLQGSGTLAQRPEDSTWEIDGSVASPSLVAWGLDMGMLEHRIRFTPTEFALSPVRDVERLPSSFLLEAVRANYAVTREALVVDSIRGKMFGGEIGGKVTLPLEDRDDLVARLTIDQLRPTVRVPIAGGISAAITATLSSEVDWRVPVRDVWSPRAHNGTATLKAADIRIGEAAVGELDGELVVDAKTLSIEASGSLFDGEVDISTTSDLQASQRWSDVGRQLKASRFEIDGVSFGPLLDLLTGERLGFSGRLRSSLRTASGSASEAQQEGAEATVFAELLDLQYRSAPLARRVTLSGWVDRGVLVLRSLAGDYAGGSLRMAGRVDLFDTDGAVDPRLNLTAAVTGIRADRGLGWIGDYSDQIDGRVSGKATVTGDLRSLAVRGNLTGVDMAAYGFQIGKAHSELFAKLDLASLSWGARFPNVSARVGRGQLDGEAWFRSTRGGGIDLATSWRAKRVDFVQLAQQFGTPTSLARGRLSGGLTLEGKAVRGVEDLAGRFSFRLSNTRGAAIPGLAEASSLLGPISLATQSFEAGEAKGIIGRGAVVINEFWLGSDDALVRADGKIYLASKRMDLMAVIATGDYSDIAADFNQLATDNLLAAVLPAAAVLRVSELLRDRTLVVAINGTLAHPIVRPRPVETFRAEVARFLLREGQRLILGGIGVEAIDGLDDGF